MALGPFDLSGGPFLTLYAILFLFACYVSLAWSRSVRPAGRQPARLKPEEMAVLAGGLPRHNEVVAAELLACRHLAIGPKDELLLADDSPATPAITALRALPMPRHWPAARRALNALGEHVRVRLATQGLLIDGSDAWRLRIVQALPFVPLAAFGLIKLVIGEMRGRPVGFLVIALIATAIVAVVRFAGVDARTKAGQSALADARARHERLRRAPTMDEVGLGVALFGTSVLMGSAWEVLHRLRTAGGDGGASTVDGGSSDGGSGCGSGGCGGGGCGGCSS